MTSPADKSAPSDQSALQAIHRLAARLGVLAANAAALVWDPFGIAERVDSGFVARDGDGGDLFLIRRPDGPDGERWVLFGGDHGLFGPIDAEEDWDAFFRAGERGPGAPEWVGFAHQGDTSKLTGEALGMFAWFDAGRWHQAGAILDRLPEPDSKPATNRLAELDPIEPWRHGRLARIGRMVATDEAVRMRMLASGRFELHRDVAGDADLAALVELTWNALITDEVATDPVRLAAHFRAVAGRLRTNAPDDDQLAEAVAIAGEVRRLVGGPLPLDPRPRPVEFGPAEEHASAAGDAAARDRVHEVVRWWAAAVAAEVAAELPDAQRRFRFDEFGLTAAAADGVYWLLGNRPDQLVLVRRGTDGDPSIASFLWPGDRRIDVPDWIPYAELAARTADRAQAVSWTMRGRWRRREQSEKPPVAWPSEWQVSAPDQPLTVAGTLRAAVDLQPRRGLFGRRRPSADQADAVRADVERFLGGQGVLAAGNLAAYPSVPEVEPVNRQAARAEVQQELSQRLVRHGAAGAIGRVIGIEAALPPLPPADLDPLDGLPGTDRHELRAAGIGRLTVPDLDEEALATRVAVTGVEARRARALVRSYVHRLRYAKPHNPGGRPAPEILGVLARDLGVPVDPQVITEASRTLAAYGYWPKSVPADSRPSA